MHKNTCYSPRPIVVGLLALASSLLGAQTPIQVTESVSPGDSFSLVGDDLRSTDEFQLSRVESDGSFSTPMVCAVQNMNESIALLTAPPSLPKGLWRLQVVRGGTPSAPIMLNRARVVMVDADMFRPGETVRIYGHNLASANGGKPLVDFVDESGNRSAASVLYANPHYALLYAPRDTVAGRKYRVAVSNGDGALDAAEAFAPQPLAALVSDADPLGLKVPWAGQFSDIAKNTINIRFDPRLVKRPYRDGVHDDTAAVQDAIDLAARLGGGVVYLPEGTYKLDRKRQNGRYADVEIPANVVLRGDGKGKTVLTYGQKYVPGKEPNPAAYWLCMKEGGRNGLMDLTATNLNTSRAGNATIRRGSGEITEEFFFLKNVEIKLGRGGPVQMDNTRHGLITGCFFQSYNTSERTVDLGSSTWMRFLNNRVDYLVNRIATNFMADSQIIGNTFNRDMKYAISGKRETGCLETSYSQRIVVQDNDIIGRGQVSKKGTGDGEMILTQRGALRDETAEAPVTSATDDSVYCAKGSWRKWDWRDPNYQRGEDRMYVAVVSGKGTGQWRMIRDVVYKTINVTEPWTVKPDSSSVVIISSLNNHQQFIMDNTIVNGTTSVSFYQGAMDSVISNNQIIDGGPVLLRGFSQPIGGSGSNNDLVWGCVVDGNSLSNSNASMPAAISLSACSSGNRTLDSDLLSNVVRDNRIDVTGRLTSYNYVVATSDGFHNQHIPYKSPLNLCANMGSVFNGNVAYGLTDALRVKNVIYYGHDF